VNSVYHVVYLRFYTLWEQISNGYTHIFGYGHSNGVILIIVRSMCNWMWKIQNGRLEIPVTRLVHKIVCQRAEEAICVFGIRLSNGTKFSCTTKWENTLSRNPRWRPLALNYLNPILSRSSVMCNLYSLEATFLHFPLLVSSHLVLYITLLLVLLDS